VGSALLSRRRGSAGQRPCQAGGGAGVRHGQFRSHQCRTQGGLVALACHRRRRVFYAVCILTAPAVGHRGAGPRLRGRLAAAAARNSTPNTSSSLPTWTRSILCLFRAWTWRRTSNGPILSADALIRLGRMTGDAPPVDKVRRAKELATAPSCWQRHTAQRISPSS